jgi:hypothetical protein
MWSVGFEPREWSSQAKSRHCVGRGRPNWKRRVGGAGHVGLQPRGSGPARGGRRHIPLRPRSARLAAQEIEDERPL